MKRKLFLYFSIILIGSILLAVFVGYRTISDFMVEEIESRISIETVFARDSIEKELNNLGEYPSSDFFDELVKKTDCRLSIIQKDGQVYYDSVINPRTMENHLDRPEVQRAIEGQTGITMHYSETLRKEFIYSTTPIYEEGELVFILRLSTPLDNAVQLVDKLSRSLIISILSGMLFAIIMAYIASGYIVRPIINIAKTALKEADYNLVDGDAVFKGNELALIATALKNMSSKLNESRTSINDKNVKMEAILSSVLNGIIAIDNEEKVLFINSSAHSLLKIKEEKAEGKYFFRIVKNRVFNNFVEKSVRMKEYSEAEISIGTQGGRVFRVYSNPIKHRNTEELLGSIVVIQDITDIRKLERMRRDFTANVSHELKTPLTSIKGFAETLRSGAIDDAESADRFLGIIQSEANRLQRLIEDILSLTDVETGKDENYFEDFDVFQVIEEVISILEEAASKKSVIVKIDAVEDPGQIYGDRDQFKQMLINLIENGIKYNRENGSLDIIVTKPEPGTMKIVIRDSGIGIEEEDIPRIFERFYRVDKARSRIVGGTGLGLAIVKHIIKNFDGKLEVVSTVGKGSDFIVEIPVTDIREDRMSDELTDIREERMSESGGDIREDRMSARVSDTEEDGMSAESGVVSKMIESGLLIVSVEKDSIGYELGIKKGDRLISINDESVGDSIEYKFHEASEELVLKIKKENGQVVSYEIDKDCYEEVGIIFEDMISGPKVCTNNCVFCFVDQMPQGMRKSLYIKDDDSRMSFLQGSFVTLTNMKPEDIDRIIKYRISPINVSIHTTNPELRVQMLKNRFAGKIMEYLEKLSQNGIEIKGQIVLCPGINDGENLKKSIYDLAELWPSMSCLAIVPVGITKYREGLSELRVVEKEEAVEIIDTVSEWQKDLYNKLGSRFVYCSDEFYIIGEKPFLPYEEYEGFPQIENGVGLITLFKEEIDISIDALKPQKAKERDLTVLTGEYAAPIIEEALKGIEKKLPGLKYCVKAVKNDFFGHTVKVAGLLTGSDIIKAILENSIKGNVLISDSMIKEGTELFLDDITISDVEKNGVALTIAREDGSDLVRLIKGL